MATSVNRYCHLNASLPIAGKHWGMCDLAAGSMFQPINKLKQYKNMKFKPLPQLLMVSKFALYGMVLQCFFLSVLLAHEGSAQEYKSVKEVYVTLDFDNDNLRSAFAKIESVTDLHFAFNREDLKRNIRFNESYKQKSLYEILLTISRDSRLMFQQVNNVINVSTIPREEINQERVEINLQSFTVSGKVTDDNKEGLPGVNVVVKGTTTGTVTDINGSYTIEAPDEDATLIFSFIGFVSEEVAVNGRSVIDMTMTPDVETLQEVVVVGYGTQKKISVVGAQSTVEPAELQLPVGNLSTSLGGRLAGVVSVQRSGEPGGNDADIFIRGISTFSNSFSKPLVLVDGVPRPLADIDPQDIKTFSILKDASATAVYGVRGANGVILITTKQGTPGKPEFNIRYNEGITSFTKTPDFANGVTYMKMANEALTNRGALPRYSAEAIEATRTQTDPYLYPDVDWYNELFNDWGRTRKFNMNINGGSERATYYVSTGYYHEIGLYKTDELEEYDSQVGYKRYNLTANLTMKPSNSTTVRLGVQGYLANVNYPGTNARSIFEKAFFMTPVLTPVTYEDGRIADVAASSVQNPYGLLTRTGYANQWRNQIFSNLRVTQELDFLVKGLSATGMFSFDAYNYVSLRRTKTPDTWLANGRDEEGNLIYQQTRIGTEFLDYSRNNNGSRTLYSEAALNYNNDFGNHSVGGMILFNQSDEINTQASSFENSLPYRFRGLASRLTYAFRSKYFAELNFGYNGSENFLPEKRYGFFPSVGLGWLLSEETFFEPLQNIVQTVKFRFSHGIVGNSNIGGRRFSYLGTVASTGGYSFGSTPVAFSGYDIGEYAVDVTWETSTKTNIGIDLWTLNRSLNLQVDLFKEHREGIFLRRATLPNYVGMRNNPYGNVGIIDNKGVDMSMTYSGKFGRDFNFDILANFTYNRNEVIEDDQPEPKYPWLDRKGLKVGQRFGYIALGLFESEEEIANSAFHPGDVRPGDIKFKDMNSDGRIDGYDEAPIGYGQVPEIVYGFGVSLNYKAFTLSTLFQGVGNMDIWLNGEGLIPFQQGMSRGNLFNNIEDRWTIENPNPDAFYPRLGSGTINENYSTSSWWIANGRYLRLKSLELRYQLPQRIVEKIKLKNADIFFSGVNLLTFSPFELWDPELGDGSGSYPGGALYPNVATYSVGFNLNF